MSFEKKSVVHKGQNIYYILNRKDVKNINLRIKADQSIVVSAKRRISVETIEDFMLSKIDFILKALHKLSKRNQPTPKEYRDGEIFKILGVDVKLCLEKSIVEGVTFTGDRLLLSLNDLNNYDRKKVLLDAWIKKETQIIFYDIVNQVSFAFNKYNVSCSKITIRSMKSRWGSCRTHKGAITLNSRLIETPIKCIEYVVYHEFSHLLYPNHSSLFYAFLKSILPDYKEREKLLNTYHFL